jgi:hypothetical protein
MQHTQKTTLQEKGMIPVECKVPAHWMLPWACQPVHGSEPTTELPTAASTAKATPDSMLLHAPLAVLPSPHSTQSIQPNGRH